MRNTILCKACGGSGEETMFVSINGDIYDETFDCGNCNGTGIRPITKTDLTNLYLNWMAMVWHMRMLELEIARLKREGKYYDDIPY